MREVVFIFLVFLVNFIVFMYVCVRRFMIGIEYVILFKTILRVF